MGVFFVVLKSTGLEPEKVWALRKQFGELFLAKSGEAGTECEALGRRANSMRSEAQHTVKSCLKQPTLSTDLDIGEDWTKYKGKIEWKITVFMI